MISKDTLFISQNGQVQKINIDELSSIEVKRKTTGGKISADVLSVVGIALIAKFLIIPSMLN